MFFFVAFSELVECDRKATVAQALSVASRQNGKHVASLNVSLYHFHLFRLYILVSLLLALQGCGPVSPFLHIVQVAAGSVLDSVPR